MKTLKKTITLFVVAILVQSCLFAYDPPLKGNEILIHNQTDKALLILDSLTAG